MSCSIPGDPDIAGLGVRIAIYVQAFLCMLPSVLLALFGPDPDSHHAAVVAKSYSQGRTTVTTLLVTNGALLVVSFVKVHAGTLSHYHAALVLNLSWIVFVSALSSAITLSFSHPLRNKPGFMLWLRLVLLPVLHGETKPPANISLPGLIPRLRRSRIRLSKVLRSEHHIFLLSLHIFGTGVLGVILFGDYDGFGHRVTCNSDVVLWTFNFLLPISGLAFQHFWFAVYVISLIPFANIFFCAVVIVFICASPLWAALWVARRISARFLDLPRVVTRLGIVLPFLAMTILLVASTERTISTNRSTKAVGSGENEWGFGQILALILLLPPAIETYNRIRVIFARGPVALPDFPARDAEKADAAPERREAARKLAASQRREWIGALGQQTLTDLTTLVQLKANGSGMLEVPTVKGFAVIKNATIDEVFGVIAPIGMRPQWDPTLDYDGVLRRYDEHTIQRYAVTKGETSASGAALKPRDIVVVQQVHRSVDQRDGETIAVTYASMDADDSPERKMDGLPKQPGRVRARLPFEGWLIKQAAADVELTCVARRELEDTLPLATARYIVRLAMFYPTYVLWAHANYGFAPFWGLPGVSGNGAAVLEVERMDTDTGAYTATFRTRGRGEVTVVYDIEGRKQYKKGALTSWDVLEGSRKYLTATDDEKTGRLTFHFEAAEMVVEVTIVRRLRSSVPVPRNAV